MKCAGISLCNCISHKVNTRLPDSTLFLIKLLTFIFRELIMWLTNIIWLLNPNLLSFSLLWTFIMDMVVKDIFMSVILLWQPHRNIWLLNHSSCFIYFVSDAERLHLRFFFLMLVWHKLYEKYEQLKWDLIRWHLHMHTRPWTEPVLILFNCLRWNDNVCICVCEWVCVCMSLIFSVHVDLSVSMDANLLCCSTRDICCGK